MSNKVKIRSKLLKARSEIKADQRLLKNEQIAKNLESLEVFKGAQHVLFYYSVGSEVGTLDLIEKYIDSKQLYLPVITGLHHFQAIPIKRPLDLKKSFEGIPEPMEPAPSSVFDKRIDCVIVPGVAFDKHGNRIGTGKGYYDRYFEKYPDSTKIGLAYSEQMLDCIPKDPYDIGMNFVITDNNTYKTL
jgi:5-formyltetrahydrofolate cyclo-ligase